MQGTIQKKSLSPKIYLSSPPHMILPIQLSTEDHHHLPNQPPLITNHSHPRKLTIRLRISDSHRARPFHLPPCSNHSPYTSSLSQGNNPERLSFFPLAHFKVPDPINRTFCNRSTLRACLLAPSSCSPLFSQAKASLPARS